jgi:hypothetical protein
MHLRLLSNTFHTYFPWRGCFILQWLALVFSVATLNPVTMDVLQLFHGDTIIVRYAFCHYL